MENNELEQHLETICMELIEAPDNLVSNTKRKLYRNSFLNAVISISLSINALIMIFIIISIGWPGLGWTEKFLWICGINLTFNGLVVMVLLNRDKITSLYREFIRLTDH